MFGLGGRRTSKVNIGALKKGYVNIAVHGHLPTLVSQICTIGASEEYLEKAKAIGAKGIQSTVSAALVCPACTATKTLFHCVMLSVRNLYLVLGALDCWVADVQRRLPCYYGRSTLLQHKSYHYI